MKIHTVKPGETIFKIAREHSSSPMKIIENNDLENPDRLSVGQELLILNPTRTYTVRGADTLEKIKERFKVEKEKLNAYNPYLAGGDKIYPGQLLAIKYDTPKLRLALANGYLFSGCSEERLSLCMPYLNYLTLSSAKRTERGIVRIFDDRWAVDMAKERGKIPLCRIYDNINEDYKNSYIDEILSYLKNGGYKGVTLASHKAIKRADGGFCDFLISLKKQLLENDLLLFSELDGNEEINLPDICDGYTLAYEKCNLEDIPTFENGEKRVLEEFADRCEAPKTFVELPSFGYVGTEEIRTKDAERLAYSSAKEINYDKEKKINRFEFNKYRGSKKEVVNVIYESLHNVKAKLDALGELGFMGVFFDVMNVPVSYLMMYETMFRHYASI